MNIQNVLCGGALLLLSGGTATAQAPAQPPVAMETPLKPLPASAAIQPGSRASGDAPTAYALPAEAFHLWASNNKAFQIAAGRLAMTKARSPAARAYAAHLVDAYANGYATLHNIPPSPSGGPATMTQAQRVMLALLNGVGTDFDRLFLAGQIDSQRAAQGIAQSYAVGGVGGISRAGAAEAVTTTQILITEAEEALGKLAR